ncbi:MAG: restriction endonuclease subunit S [Acidimicrobiales bacterium]
MTSWRTLRQHAVQLTTGPFGTVLAAEEYVEGGVPLINPTHIREGQFIPDSAVSVDEVTARRLSRHRLEAGDLVVGRHGDVGRSALVTHAEQGWLCGGGSIAIRAGERLEPRFLQWFMSGTHARTQLLAASKGATMDTINEPILKSVSVWTPPLAEQRAIADYLDAETARIDALVAKKQQLIHLLEARWQARLESAIRELGGRFGVAPLKFVVAAVQVGIVITPAKWYVAEGVPAIRGMNVRAGEIDRTELVYLSREGHAENRKSKLAAGDVVVVRTGQAGAAAVVPQDLDGANCIDVLIIRPGRKVDPEFLQFVLNSDWTKKHIAEHSVGSIQAHFNVGSMKGLSFR